MSSSDMQVQRRDLILGIGLPIGIYLFLALTTFLGMARFTDGWIMILVFLWGLFQWVYLIPLALYQKKHQNHSFSLGLWIGGGLVMLLWGVCWGVAMSELGNMH